MKTEDDWLPVLTPQDIIKDLEEDIAAAFPDWETKWFYTYHDPAYKVGDYFKSGQVYEGFITNPNWPNRGLMVSYAVEDNMVEFSPNHTMIDWYNMMRDRAIFKLKELIANGPEAPV